MLQKSIIISGSTASGKSNLAHFIADNLSAEIINCDSVQLYKGFDIGSAKPDLLTINKYKYHLIDVATADQPWDVAKYRKELILTLQQIDSNRANNIIVGGTSLYIKAFLCGLIELELANPVIRNELEALSLEELNIQYDEIYKNQKITKRVNINDKVRLIRAIEIYQQTGKTKELLIQEQSKPNLACLIILPIWNRSELYQRINHRTEVMLNQGIIEETKNLLLKYSADKSIFRALGYAQVCDYLEGKITEQELANEIAQYTRRYAKRQMTFWRNEPKKNFWQKYKTKRDYNTLEVEGYECLEVTASELLVEVNNFYQSVEVNKQASIYVLPIVASKLGI